MRMNPAFKLLLPLFLLVLASYSQAPANPPLPTPPFSQCPPVGLDSGCAVLLVIDNQGSLRVVTDPSQGPFDGIEDTLIGVQNNSSKTVLSIPLKSASPIFSFDGDGLCNAQGSPAGCPFGPTSYEGPGTSFSNIGSDQSSGTVNFAGGIPAGGSAYFSLELAITTLCPPINGVPLLRQFSPPWRTETYDHSYVTRNFASASNTPISSSLTLELAIFAQGTGQASTASNNTQITLTALTNNLNGLRDAINAANTGVTASVVARSGGTSALSLTAPANTNSLQLRLTPGNPTSNILTSVKAEGCWLTSSVMILNYHAAQQGVPFSTTPELLNDFLNDQPHGYIAANVNPSEVVNYARQHGINLSYAGRIDGRDDFTLDSYICQGLPAMLKVGNPHFVVATGQTTVNGTGTYSINDPGHLNDTLQGYNFTYSGLRLFKSSFLSPSALYVAAHSPVELVVTDPSGRKTGLDAATGTSFQQIPDSSYGSDSIQDDDDPTTADPAPEVKSFEALQPISGNYKVDVIGTGSGDFSIDFIAYDVFGGSSSVTLNGVASPGVSTSYQVSYSDVPGSQVQVQPTDNIPPVTVATPTPAANGNGWNNTNVTVNFASTDNPGGSGVREIHIALSGAQTGATVVPGSTASITVSREGNTNVSFFAVDNAGNSEAPKSLTLNLDKTPPSVTGLPASACTLWPPNHKLVQMATVSATDGLSGLASFNVSVTSSEPAGAEPDFVVSGSPLQPQTVQLRAERLGNGPGRTYTIIATASDIAGNTAVSRATCTVPHDQGH